ncbi:hypothetical protein N7491_005798 [Penicillium cf. griseofulvum]|uniref:Uncharacterized protein n=1 Tax=Penicillium cf. griseofulvum TaxID=2972120 RepID=A0A9W9J489_9EURO|nr:hypothetical protein N7472_008481 [Penicillium cf. griseofulvum]KAJ5435203.1 hypothetical protein N7491_005798 [Penicillium cf. griseofulvum]
MSYKPSFNILRLVDYAYDDIRTDRRYTCSSARLDICLCGGHARLPHPSQRCPAGGGSHYDREEPPPGISKRLRRLQRLQRLWLSFRQETGIN